jgi:hypothetical protein
MKHSLKKKPRQQTDRRALVCHEARLKPRNLRASQSAVIIGAELLLLPLRVSAVCQCRAWLFAAHDPADALFAEKFAKASPGALGGTREGMIAAQADSWPKALAFLNQALGG